MRSLSWPLCKVMSYVRAAANTFIHMLNFKYIINTKQLGYFKVSVKNF